MKKTKTASKQAKGGNSPSQLIDARIEALGDWRRETLARVRKLIRQADPDVVEEVKWIKPSNSMLGVPVWSHAGIICTGETYKSVVKMTFVARSGPSRSAVPIDREQSFRLIPIIRSGITISLWTGANGTVG